MPGSSLWLLPPQAHPVRAALSTLIASTLPAALPAEAGVIFEPHMTLTSDIPADAYGKDPQSWLDAIPWPAASAGDGVRVRLASVASQDVFVRRCYIQVHAGQGGVRDLVGFARAHAVYGEEDASGPETRAWLQRWEEAYGPHVSLIYGNVPMDEAKLRGVTRLVGEAGIRLNPSGETAAVESEAEGEGRWDGWEGGILWLVPTDKPIAEWKPIATRVI
ncbi:2',3'-cyclic-nucleotide 3'-phosphodiesterase [Lasiosphaeria miniovina]|uniref:2',3'-cyclic-nucleotide 3'-phosphodiesterase n=1 Tax=Lasiosphaeria miniovina TaxID=1954250 RepID=A0AA40DMN5_9PEZI|nr:2',3'-cyclic-nucleotide 3'-phosphodiesterase [Lasiosphaeria miniovina]KAK0709324.1 2',3'-cyclic-nucleotide 3'-phosphodiesterase [Lasiosphaeria miniovina]